MMQFINLAAQQRRIRESIEARVQRVLEHGQYIMGPEVAELEHILSAYVGAKHAVGCASGTDALLLALMAFGVKPGDAVFTTPFTFIATAEAIALLGATPVFIDIEPDSFNLDPSRLKQAVEAMAASTCFRRSPGDRPGNARLRARGIVSVDLFGRPADYGRIGAIADAHDLFVIEDAAQSFGAEYMGDKACGLGHVGCTSFFPAKPLGGYGDGGMCFTDDDVLAATMRSLRNHGQGEQKYDHVRIGINGRLDTLQAAVVLAKFEIFAEELELRQRVAENYGRLLNELSVPVTPPAMPRGYVSAWAQYSILAADERQREILLGGLHNEGVPTAIYYPKPLHLQAAFAYLGCKEGDFPVSEQCARRIFSLPMHPYLERSDQARIVELLARTAHQ